jgi:hypothetical protein
MYVVTEYIFSFICISQAGLVFLCFLYNIRIYASNGPCFISFLPSSLDVVIVAKKHISGDEAIGRLKFRPL